jgi:hypothetical protein
MNDSPDDFGLLADELIYNPAEEVVSVFGKKRVLLTKDRTEAHWNQILR